MANTTDYTRLLDGYALLAIKAYIANNYAAKSHTHTKSQITDFPSSMPASDVYAWAKAATKPSYTLDEVSDGSTRKLSDYLTKITYEWNKDISFGSSGYLKIGSFQMYDSNVTINIDATTNQTFHGTVIIASQNTSASSIGSVHIVRVYDDPSGTIANSLRIVWTNGSRNYDVYFVPQAWSKNIIHIRANGIYGVTDICISQTGTPPSTTSGLEPVNVLTTTFAPLSHTHSYAGSSSAGGAATSANKLNTNAGSATNPVYFANGIPVACTYSLNKTVPADAVFTDTTYSAGTGLTLSSNQFSISVANASTILNLLTTGSSTPTDADYYISQYVGGGTTTTTYHRRPMSALWTYIKGKSDSTYLGINAKAADSSKLDGHALSYFITTDNIASQSVYHASTSDYATDAGTAANSTSLGGNGPNYYLNYNNFTNTPSVVLYTSQTLTDAQKTQARSNIGAGTSSFTGYTSSNKLSTNYIQNDAGWTSNAGTVTQVKVGTTAYNPSSGVVSLPAYPTKSSWNYDDVYVKLTGNQSIAGTKTFTGKITLSDGQNSYALTPGQGGDVVLELVDEQDNETTVYLMNPNTPSTAQYIALRSWVNDQGFLKTAVTKLGSRTGDITIANLKTDLGLGSAAYTNSTAYATSGHTHTLSISAGGTASINLAANTTYTLTAGGTTYAFKTPPAGGSGYYSNQYNSAYYLTSNSGATLFAEDIQAGNAVIGLQGGNASLIGIGWPGLATDTSKKSLLFSGNRVDLVLADNYQNYIKGLSIDMYDDDYYMINIRANEYSDLEGTVASENYANLNLHAYSFTYTPYSTHSAVTSRKYVNLGVVMHNITYTYSSSVLLKMNIRGNSPNDSAITTYTELCRVLYNAGHRSANTCLTCSGRYSSYSMIVLGVYATASNSGLYLVYCSSSNNTVSTLSIASGTVTDTMSASLVP